jgi:hypothetical protein
VHLGGSSNNDKQMIEPDLSVGEGIPFTLFARCMVAMARYSSVMVVSTRLPDEFVDDA